MQPHISLAAEKIGYIFGFAVTNSILMTWIVMGIMVFFTFVTAKNLTLVPKHLQSIAEIIIEGLHSLFTSVVGKDKIAMFFPLLATIFLFVVFSNWSGLLPGVGSIGLNENKTASKIFTPVYASIVNTNDAEAIKTENETQSEDSSQAVEKKETHEKFIPLLRGPTADLNTTLALALVAVVSLQYYGFKTLGVSYLSKFFNFSNPINFFLGILELISEAAKIVSFAFRLFGNIFAGEVLLTVIAFLMPIIAPLPFIGLELFVGVIQALVFSLLTAVFLNMATMSHELH